MTPCAKRFDSLHAAAREAFATDGVVVIERGLGDDELRRLQTQVEAWQRAGPAVWQAAGSLPNGKPIFEIDSSTAQPTLRRIGNPCDFSALFKALALRSIPQRWAQFLVGPNVRFHHCKLNIKPAGSTATIQFHQDFGFDPHTNDDFVTVSIAVDGMDSDNGCLRYLPGSHNGPRTHFSAGRFLGRIAELDFAAALAQSVPVPCGPGDVVLMNGYLVHGSEANRSHRPRTLFLAEYAAADAQPLAPYHVQSLHSGEVVLGGDSGTVRHRPKPYPIETPPAYAATSIFALHEAPGD